MNVLLCITGNGLIRVAHDQPHNVWYPSGWTIHAPHPRPTLTRNGHVHVHHTGVYLVYVQVKIALNSNFIRMLVITMKM